VLRPAAAPAALLLLLLLLLNLAAEQDARLLMAPVFRESL